MKSIQPLKYNIKLYKKNISHSTLENYKDINFLKKSIEEFFFYFENKEFGKFKPKKIQGRKVGLYQEIEIQDDKYLFINFKYGDGIVKTNNSVVVENDEITQKLKEEGDFLSDFPCAIEFNIDDSDTKYFKIYGKMCIIANGNEQMKGKIQHLFEKIFIHNDVTNNSFKEEIKINFHFEEEEINIINKKVKSIEMIYEVDNKDKRSTLEKGKKQKHARINVKLSNWFNSGINEEDELEKYIEDLNQNIGNFGKLVSKTAHIRSDGRNYQSNIKNLNDELVVNLKESVITNKKEIYFNEFKQYSLGFFK